MSSLDFLQDLQNLEITAGGGRATSKTVKTKVARQPDVADIRVWKDGAVYPSNALIKEFDLEYRDKSVSGGQGFDIVDGRKSVQLKGVAGLFISAVSKDAPKGDIFTYCTWDKDGKPMKTVAEQGSFAYGSKTLLPLIKEIYGIEPNTEGYIDLVIMRDIALTSPNGVWNLPKIVSTGPNKGQDTYQRRENSVVYPLISATSTPTSEVATTEDSSKVESTVATSMVETEVDTAAPIDAEVDGEVSLAQEERAEPVDFFSDEVLTKQPDEDPFAQD